MGNSPRQNGKELTPGISLFYGSVDERGFLLSTLLYERHIDHEFFLIEGDFILSFQQRRDVFGFDRIKKYLEAYEYVFDMWP